MFNGHLKYRQGHPPDLMIDQSAFSICPVSDYSLRLDNVAGCQLPNDCSFPERFKTISLCHLDKVARDIGFTNQGIHINHRLLEPNAPNETTSCKCASRNDILLLTAPIQDRQAYLVRSQATQNGWPETILREAMHRHESINKR